MAAISTPTPSQSALLDPSQTLTAIGGKEMSSRAGARARDARAREVALHKVHIIPKNDNHASHHKCCD